MFRFTAAEVPSVFATALLFAVVGETGIGPNDSQEGLDTGCVPANLPHDRRVCREEDTDQDGRSNSEIRRWRGECDLVDQRGDFFRYLWVLSQLKRWPATASRPSLERDAKHSLE